LGQASQKKIIKRYEHIDRDCSYIGRPYMEQSSMTAICETVSN